MQKILVVPGFWSDGQTVMDVVCRFLAAGFAVEVMTFRKTPASTMTDFIRQTAAVVQSDHIRFLFGHSAGGLICAKVAELLPEVVKCLLLWAPAMPRGIMPIRNQHQLMALIRTAPALFGDWFRPGFQTASATLFNAYSQSDQQFGYSRLTMEPVRAFKSVFVPGVAIRQVTQPAFLAVGTEDLTTPPEAVIRFSRRFPRCQQVRYVPNADHMGILAPRHLGCLDEPIKFITQAFQL